MLLHCARVCCSVCAVYVAVRCSCLEWALLGVYDSTHWKCGGVAFYTRKNPPIEQLRFLDISRYKFKLRICLNLNLYRGIWVSRFGSFARCSIFNGICHVCYILCCCIVLVCVAVCCSVLQCVAAVLNEHDFMYVCVCIHTHTHIVRMRYTCIYTHTHSVHARQQQHTTNFYVCI